MWTLSRPQTDLTNLRGIWTWFRYKASLVQQAPIASVTVRKPTLDHREYLSKR